jgi:hypothetical protein
MNRSVDEANNDYIGSKNLQKALADIQGISEKCTGAFKFQCLVIFEVSIYPKITAKAVSSVYLSIKFIKKNY